MVEQVIKEEYKYGFHDNHINVQKFEKGLSHDVVSRISHIKGEPTWMRQRRLEALEIFNQKPMPDWGGDMSGIDFNNIIYLGLNELRLIRPSIDLQYRKLIQ